MVKLKDLLKESKYAWDRSFGDPLPTFKDVIEKHSKTSLNELKKTPYIAHQTNVDVVEPAIFDNQKRLNVYKKGDTFEYISKKTKRRLGVFKAIDNVKPIDGAKLTSAEKKKKAEVFSQIAGTTVKHFLRVKRIG